MKRTLSQPTCRSACPLAADMADEESRVFLRPSRRSCRFSAGKTNRGRLERKSWQDASESFHCEQARYSFFLNPLIRALHGDNTVHKKHALFFFSFLNQSNKPSAENNDIICRPRLTLDLLSQALFRGRGHARFPNCYILIIIIFFYSVIISAVCARLVESTVTKSQHTLDTLKQLPEKKKKKKFFSYE